ncbi:hypothetical protein LX32DRAFT_278646 [Colletotrichum zoysiae]|uniref:Uncharacterized protein n=1 Tax=Colletotrichum zoysiae TaxID=1216348 RepID=A0AAD9H2S6_9PEZI|nr:hypothetical protein LX32DRAFT_278646 [Colletotrichum zoysiae]
MEGASLSPPRRHGRGDMETREDAAALRIHQPTPVHWFRLLLDLTLPTRCLCRFRRVLAPGATGGGEEEAKAQGPRNSLNEQATMGLHATGGRGAGSKPQFRALNSLHRSPQFRQRDLDDFLAAVHPQLSLRAKEDLDVHYYHPCTHAAASINCVACLTATSDSSY